MLTHYPLLSLALGLLAGPGPLDGEGKLPPGARIAVIVSNSTGVSNVDRVAGDMLAGALRRRGVRVVERAELDAVLQEQRLSKDGTVDPATAVPAGRVLGADHLLLVKATEFGVKDDRIGAGGGSGLLGGIQLRTSTSRVVLDARLVKSATSEVLATESAEGKQVNRGATLIGGSFAGGRLSLGAIDIGSKEWSESSLGKAARKAVEDLSRKLTGVRQAADGAVLAVQADGRAIVSLGSADQVREGDRLEVVRLETVRNSRGEVVWSDERSEGWVRVLEVKGDRCRVAPAEKGLKLSEGDLVRAAREPARPAERDDP